MSSSPKPATAAPADAPPNDTDAAQPTSNGEAAAQKATSEANIAAADPAAPNGIPESEKNDANVDEKAADTAEGAVSGATVVAPESTDTPASGKKGKQDPKRRSSGVPEHKSKKKGGKKEITLNLDCQPGDYYFARMKGHPPWPSIIADEDMLPDAIMATRPVTARRVDGSYREDFADGGKNAKERTYAVMFLHTNEFAWMPNPDLEKVTPEKLETPPAKGSKSLLAAFDLAKKEHDLEYFKGILSKFEEARRNEEVAYQEKQEKAAAKEAKKEQKGEGKATKGKRKSTATVGDNEDVEMENSEEAPKSTKKRKKSMVDSDDAEQPSTKKTPKTIRLNGPKDTNGETPKEKKKVKTPKSTKDTKEQPQMSEKEKLEKKEKNVLYLRHRLQKGFLQNTAPEENQMPDMASHLDQLEQYKELEVNIIRQTKIHKVLKAILKLDADTIPRNKEFSFMERSKALLSGWLTALESDEQGTSNGATGTDAAKSAGTKTDQPKTEETKADTVMEDAPKTEGAEKKDEPAPVTEPASAPVEATQPGNDAKDEAADADVAMKDDVPDAAATDKDKPADVEAPAEATAETSGPAAAAAT